MAKMIAFANKITIDSFMANGFNYFLPKPIEITPKLEDGVYSAIYEPLGIDVYAESSNDLVDAIQEDLAWKWTHFVNANERHLASDALFIRSTLLDTVMTSDACFV